LSELSNLCKARKEQSLELVSMKDKVAADAMLMESLGALLRAMLGEYMPFLLLP
jgi:hypothetical protein